MAHYLVTGGLGFIGSHLVEALLAAGNRVTVLDDGSTGRPENVSPEVPVVLADVANGQVVRRALHGLDGCFHLAANPSVPRCLEDYLGTHRTNLTGTVAVLDAAAREGRERGVPIPVVYASSCAVYGNPKELPLRESSPTLPLSSYGADKLAGEIHARMAAGVLGVPSLGLRLFNVYGPRQDPNSPYSGVLSIFCHRLAAGEGVTVFGDGRQVRDFVYVGDVVTRFLSAMARVRTFSPAVVNVCTGRRTSLLEVGRIVAGLCRRSFAPEFAAERTGDIKVSVGDPTLGETTLGPHLYMSLEEGLRRTLNAIAAREG